MSPNADLFGRAPQALAWQEFQGVCSLHYRLHVDGEPSNVWVRDCGIPHETRFFVVPETGAVLRGFVKLDEAKRAAVDQFLQQRSAA